MEKYEQISIIGEGSYGLVMKCRHKETNQLVAVKKFLETEEDEAIRKIGIREIKILKTLKHENLVKMLEIFKHKKRFYLVFEFLEWTLLDELDRMPSGLGEEKCKERIFQVLRAISYCHRNHVIHRDVKPENVLISSMGVVKLCDFGFARTVNTSDEACTEYVATRWYRAPELLLGERNYGTAVDIWAVGCLFAEMMTGDPIFPGDSDIDQVYLIITTLGKPCLRHRKLLSKSRHFKDIKMAIKNCIGLNSLFSTWSNQASVFLDSCLKMNPQQRLTADELLRHTYFTEDGFSLRLLESLKKKIEMEYNNNPLFKKIKRDEAASTDKKDELKYKRVLHNSIRKNFILTERNKKRKINCKNFIMPIKTTQGNLRKNNEYVPTDELSQEEAKFCSSQNSQIPSESLISCGIKTDEETVRNYRKTDINEQKQAFDLQSNLHKVGENCLNKISLGSQKLMNYISERNPVPMKINCDQQNYHQAGISTSITNLEIHEIKRKEMIPFTLSVKKENSAGVKKTPIKQRLEMEQVSQPRSVEVTPAYRYKKAKRRRNILDISLPFVVGT